MPLSDLLMKGVELMLIGMGSVFVFLATLVVALKGMSQLATRLQPEMPVVERKSGLIPKEEDEQLIAVISAAISRYRSNRR
jgi:oxaloacetate decarboxylase gamma subunit